MTYRSDLRSAPRLQFSRLPRRRALLLLLMSGLAGCQREEEPRDTPRSNPRPTQIGRPVAPVAESGVTPHVVPGTDGARAVQHVGPPNDTAAVPALTWDVHLLVARLRQAGIAMRAGAAPVRQPFMSAPGTVLRAPGVEVQAYVYGDHVTRVRDTDRLDPQRVGPPTTMITWREPASLVVDNNLALIVLTRDTGVRDRIRAAVAGSRGQTRTSLIPSCAALPSCRLPIVRTDELASRALPLVGSGAFRLHKNVHGPCAGSLGGDAWQG